MPQINIAIPKVTVRKRGYARPQVFHDTGMWEHGELVRVSDTHFCIKAGSGQINDPLDETPLVVKLDWPDTEDIDASSLLAGVVAGVLYVGISYDLEVGPKVVAQTVSDFTTNQLRTIIRVGRIGIVEGKLSIAVQEQAPIRGLGLQYRRLLDALGPIAFEGLDVQVHSPTELKLTPGKGFRQGADYATDPVDPHIRDFPDGIKPVSVVRLYRDGKGSWLLEGSGTDLSGLSMYDTGVGKLSALPKGKWAIHVLYLSIPTGDLYMTFGQIAINRNKVLEEVLKSRWERHPILSTDMVRRALLAVRSGYTDLGDEDRVLIISCGRFGDVGGR